MVEAGGLLMNRRSAWIAACAGCLTALLLAAFIWSDAGRVTDRLREPAIDMVAALRQPSVTDQVVVVNIASSDISSRGNHRVDRGDLATVIDRLVRDGVSAIGLDLVLGQPCDAADPGSRALAAALKTAPVTLGFLMFDRAGKIPPSRVPVAIGQGTALTGLWRSSGAEISCDALAAVVSGASSASLSGGSDGIIRSAPAVVAVGGKGFPLLAVDAVRLAKRANVLLITGKQPRLRFSSIDLPVDASASMRVRFSTAAQSTARTVPFREVLKTTDVNPDFADKIVLIGSNAPELGGLRATPFNPLTSSTQIQADIASNLLMAVAPRVPGWFAQRMFIVSLAMGIAGAMLAAFVQPALASTILVLVGITWTFACAVAHHSYNLILDPLYPVLVMLLASMVSAVLQYASVRRTAFVMRQRFEQRLPPQIVSRLISQPDILKLEGEQRYVSSMFTDVENFTTTTVQSDPGDLIQILEDYFEGMIRIVLAHDGMVDHTMGDGLHALFNLPVDLDHHEDAAVKCSTALLEFSEQFRRLPKARALNFGRTRIGIASGLVTAGDIGSSGKFDYTAIGPAINMAARLQEANKMLGTSILIAESTASRVTGGELKDVGIVDLRGVGSTRAFSPS